MPHRAATRCVVLVAPADTLPSALLEGLERRKTAAQVVTHPATALAELAAQPARALIVNEPANVGGLAELIAAVRTYFPDVACWHYARARSGAEGELHPLESADDLSALQRAEASPPTPSAVTPGRTEPPPQSNDEDSPLLTEEELAMLLGPWPDEPRRSSGAAEGERKR